MVEHNQPPDRHPDALPADLLTRDLLTFEEAVKANERRKPRGNSFFVRIADYTQTPGARFIRQGPNSGEDFRTKKLQLQFVSGIRDFVLSFYDVHRPLYGIPVTFLEEAFGGFVRWVAASGEGNTGKIAHLRELSIHFVDVGRYTDEFRQAVTFIEQARVRALHEVVASVVDETGNHPSYHARDHADNLYEKIVLQGVTW
jgi:hypothetical protein